MCVVLVYFLTLRMSIFEKLSLDDILLTKHHMIKAERAQTKSGNGYRRIIPQEITLLQDSIPFFYFEIRWRNTTFCLFMCHLLSVQL